MKVSHLLESSDKMMMLGDMKAVADKIAKAGNVKFKQKGASYEARLKGESKAEFGERAIEGNKELKAKGAEGNSEYDRWNVKTNSGTVHIYVTYDGFVRVVHEDSDDMMVEAEDSMSAKLMHPSLYPTRKSTMAPEKEKARAYNRGWRTGFGDGGDDGIGVKAEHVADYKNGLKAGFAKRKKALKAGVVIPVMKKVDSGGYNKPNGAFDKLAKQYMTESEEHDSAFVKQLWAVTDYYNRNGCTGKAEAVTIPGGGYGVEVKDKKNLFVVTVEQNGPKTFLSTEHEEEDVKLSDAKRVAKLISGWMDDYIENYGGNNGIKGTEPIVLSEANHESSEANEHTTSDGKVMMSIDFQDPEEREATIWVKGAKSADEAQTILGNAKYTKFIEDILNPFDLDIMDAEVRHEDEENGGWLVHFNFPPQEDWS